MIAGCRVRGLDVGLLRPGAAAAGEDVRRARGRRALRARAKAVACGITTDHLRRAAIVRRTDRERGAVAVHGDYHAERAGLGARSDDRGLRRPRVAAARE